MGELLGPVTAPEVNSGYRLSPPPLTAASCDPYNCSRPEPSARNSKELDVAMILVLILYVITGFLVLTFILRFSARLSSISDEETSDHQKTVVVETSRVEPPTLVFSAGMKLSGEAAECAICLSEFVEGERIRVLSRCKHGFHLHCIQQWLSCHSSCPTCRANTGLPSQPSSSSYRLIDCSA